MEIEKEPSTDLTAEECQEFADAIFKDAAALPAGPEKNEILKLRRAIGALRRSRLGYPTT